MNNKTQLTLHLIVFQLQQQNEVIALMNLLNRLSESVKFIHEMGPTAERIMEGHLFGHTKLIRPLKKIWSSILQT
jgi:ERO1-like protein alpha